MKLQQIILSFISLKYINAFVTMNLQPIKTEIVILTGSRINKSNYNSIVDNIKEKLNNKDISANIHVIDSFFKENEIKTLLKRKALNNKFHIIGHSFGSYEAGLYSKNNNKILSLIQVCGNFNLEHQHPYPSLSLDNISTPTLTILAELDNKLPVTDAILDKNLISHNNKLITLDNFEHLSIIENNIEQKEILSNIISEYIHYIETNDKNSLQFINEYEYKTDKKFDKYLNSLKHFTASKNAENAQDFICDMTDKNDNRTVYSKNYSFGSNYAEILLQSSSRYAETMLYFYRFLPGFITSRPSNTNNIIHVSVFSPFKYNLLSFLSKKRISNSEIWLKLHKKNEEIINPGMKIGESILEDVIENLSDIEKEQYKRKIVFAEDIVINSNIPMCSIIWLCTPISITYTSTNIIVRVPVLQTPTEIPDYVKKLLGDKFGNSLNIKMLSESQMYEWILVKSRM